MVYVLINARKLKYLKVISLVVFLRFFYTLILKPLNSGFEPKRGKFMVYARKALIHAGLLDTMVTQSYLDNLIETCPQITRNAVAGLRRARVRISSSPPQVAQMTCLSHLFFRLSSARCWYWLPTFLLIRLPSFCL